MWLTGRRAGLPTGCHEVSAMYSDDDGDTWQMSSSRLVAPCYDGFNGSNYGACEPNVIELDDDHVWMLMRSQTGFMYESHSHDGGSTWSDAIPSDFVSSDSPAEIMRLPDGRIIALWNNSQNPPRVAGRQVAGGRDALHAAISGDNGKTWRGCREVYRDPLRNESPPRRGDRGTAYSTGVMNEDGKIVLCTGQGEGRRAILIFSPEWLLATHHEDDFSNGFDGWCAFSEFGEPEAPVFRDRAVGPELVDHPLKAGAKALHIRLHKDKPGDGAVWNFPVAMEGSLKLRVMLNDGFGSATIALCDQLYNPSDTNGERNAIFGLPIDAQGKLLNHGPLVTSEWHDLEFRWDLNKRECDVYIDDMKALTLPMLNAAKHGISYVRIRSTAEAPDAGMLLESVSMPSMINNRRPPHVQTSPITSTVLPGIFRRDVVWLIVLVGAAESHAASTMWIGPNNGNFLADANWTLGAPKAGDSAIFNNNFDGTVTFSGSMDTMDLFARNTAGTITLCVDPADRETCFA